MSESVPKNVLLLEMMSEAEQESVCGNVVLQVRRVRKNDVEKAVQDQQMKEALLQILAKSETILNRN